MTMNRFCGLAICFVTAGLAAIYHEHTDMAIMLAAGAIILAKEDN